MNLVDTHAHLDFTDEPDRWLVGAKSEGVGRIICVGTSVEASRKCAQIAEKYSTDDLEIYATVGIHAQDGKGDLQKYGSLGKCIEELRKIVNRDSIAKQVSLQNDVGGGFQNDSERVVAVGECGYDYYLAASGQRPVTSNEEKKFQKELFEAQIQLATESQLPLIVHCRNAWEETFELLDSIAKQVSLQNDKGKVLRGVFHSWTGDWEAAQKALGLGFYISFSGIVTFKNAPKVQAVASRMPLDRMLLETDSPFLAPEPLRGKQNEPKNVKIVAEFIAKLRDLPVLEICDITSKNAERMFNF